MKELNVKKNAYYLFGIDNSSIDSTFIARSDDVLLRDQVPILSKVLPHFEEDFQFYKYGEFVNNEFIPCEPTPIPWENINLTTTIAQTMTDAEKKELKTEIAAN